MLSFAYGCHTDISLLVLCILSFSTRVLGTDMGGNMIIKGKEKKRNWSLLREPFANGQSTLKLIHDVNMMGWEVS